MNNVKLRLYRVLLIKKKSSKEDGSGIVAIFGEQG